MNIFKWIYKSKKRDVISFDKIKVGTTLKVYPISKKDSEKPFEAKVISSYRDYFIIRIIGHKSCWAFEDWMCFNYNNLEWKKYNCRRFKIEKL